MNDSIPSCCVLLEHQYALIRCLPFNHFAIGRVPVVDRSNSSSSLSQGRNTAGRSAAACPEARPGSLFPAQGQC